MAFRGLIASMLLVTLTGASSLTSPAAAQTPPQVRPEPTGGEVAASVASNVFYAPGKALICIGGGVLWVVTMAVTFGTQYDEAARLVQGACGGKWTLDDADMRQALEPVQN